MSQVLVVEDESAIAELMSINLRHAGYEVVVATTADEALQQVDRVLPDLVVLDWMLPGQSGLQLAKRWRSHARTRELPIIMLTARAEEADKISGLDAGRFVVSMFFVGSRLYAAVGVARDTSPKPCASSPNRRPSSCAVCGRFAGFFCKSCMISSSVFGVISAPYVDGFAGSTWRCAPSSSPAPMSSNGGRPATIS